MDRDEYVLLKCRQEIAKSILDKIETASIDDVGLIPAIMEYVQTGDTKMFEEYRQWHFFATAEQREAAIRRGKELLAAFEENQTKREEYMKKIQEYQDEYDAWRKSVIARLDEEVPTKEYVDLRDLQRFLTQIKDSGKSLHGRAIYVRVNNDIMRINAISLGDKSKIIMDVDGESVLHCEPPVCPNLGYDEYCMVLRYDSRKLSYLEKSDRR